MLTPRDTKLAEFVKRYHGGRFYNEEDLEEEEEESDDEE